MSKRSSKSASSSQSASSSPPLLVALRPPLAATLLVAAAIVVAPCIEPPKVEDGFVTGADVDAEVVAHRLVDDEAGAGRAAGAGACENVGLAASPMDAKISSSGKGAGAFLTGAAAVFFLPRLVIWSGLLPVDVGAVAGLKPVLP